MTSSKTDPLARGLARAARLWRNVALDLRYGGFLGGNRASRFEHLGAEPTVNSDYDVLEAIFAGEIRDDDVLVDVGCGFGRVLNHWLGHGLPNRMIGIELDPAVAKETRERLRAFSNVTIVTGDAVDELPAEGTLFYLYNPFTRPVVARFVAKLADRAHDLGRVRLFYTNPQHLDAFVEDGRWAITRFDVQRRWASRPEACARLAWRGAPET